MHRKVNLGWAFACAVLMVLSFTVGAAFVDAAADLPPHRCFSCGQ